MTLIDRDPLSPSRSPMGVRSSQQGACPNATGGGPERGRAIAKGGRSPPATAPVEEQSGSSASAEDHGGGRVRRTLPWHCFPIGMGDVAWPSNGEDRRSPSLTGWFFRSTAGPRSATNHCHGWLSAPAGGTPSRLTRRNHAGVSRNAGRAWAAANTTHPPPARIPGSRPRDRVPAPPC
jgi:hypothetical protein